MSDNQNYYYLKLKDNFFERPEIKVIQKQQNGYEYIVIMLKMHLRSLEREGALMLTDKIPYDIPMLSSVLEHKEETVKAAIEIFIKFGLLDILDNKTIFMLEIQKFIGKSSTEAERIRNYREKIRNQRVITDNNQDKDNRTNVRTDVQNCTPEIEIELKKELKTEKEINKDNLKHPHKILLNYLNQQSGKSYVLETIPPSDIYLVDSLLNSGFSIEQLKYVIWVKSEQWKNDPKMNEYLRFKTLFGKNFQDYLNAKLPEEIEKLAESERLKNEAIDRERLRKENEERLRKEVKQRREKEEQALNERSATYEAFRENPTILTDMLKNIVREKRLKERKEMEVEKAQ